MGTNTQAFVKWFQETFGRFTTPSPKYFKIIGWIGTISFGLGFIPNVLAENNLSVPSWALGTYTIIMQAAGVATKIVAMMTTDRMALVQKAIDQNKSVATVEENKLPFTTQVEDNKK